MYQQNNQTYTVKNTGSKLAQSHGKLAVNFIVTLQQITPHKFQITKKNPKILLKNHTHTHTHTHTKKPTTTTTTTTKEIECRA